MATENENELDQPLLPNASTAGVALVVEEDAEDDDLEANPWWSELPRILHLALPSAATGVLMYASRLITTAQVGRLSSLSLSSLSLALTVYNITGLSLVVGISSGITTFVGHAHGAAESSLKGVILQRGGLMALLTALLPLAGWSQVDKLLQLLGQEQQIAAGAAAFIRLVWPALLTSAINCCMMDYLAAQAVVRPLVLVTLTNTVLTPALNSIFITQLNWGFLGNAATILVNQATESLMLLAIVAWHNNRQPPGLRPWGGFAPAAALSAWLPYLSVALPSMVMICLDWWAFEALTLLAGLLPDAEVAVGAIGICFGIHVIVFLLIEGYSSAVSIRVANELGAGHPHLAWKAVVTGVCLGFGTTLLCITPLWATPRLVARVFSDDEQVVGIVVQCLPGLLVSLVGDCLNNVLSGCVRGAGKQALGSAVNFGSFWCFGLPLAWYLSHNLALGAAGLWWAMAVTSSLQGLLLSLAVCCLDWAAESERSKSLVRSQSPAS